MTRCTQPAQAPSQKTIDGDPSDWIGVSPRIGGATVLSAGELIHNDFLFDAYGADDGVDAQRLELLEPLADIDALFQAAGDQFGLPPPIGALDHYGNTTALEDEADLYELRWAADDERVWLLARFTTLTDPAKAALLVLLDGVEVAQSAGTATLNLSPGEHSVVLQAP